jgi:tyrosyl-tRNA synthetase
MIDGKQFITEFKDRGFFYQCTDEEALSDSLAKTKNPAAYIGFDGTATSLHIGSLIQLMILRMLQKHGIKPIILIGGATTKIGDPTFKDKARQLLDTEQINKNIAGIQKSISKFVRIGEEKTDAIMLNNNDWLSNLNYIDFLREYGKHFSINRMLSFESVKLRLEREQNLTFLEFNYMLLQAYDFLHLHDNHNCILQCGGSDQWGNIINGVELIRRIRGKEAFGLTTPLTTTASGIKMGKTEQGAIWLNEDLLSPYEYYQFWRNISDEDVFKFMKLYTDISPEEIKQYEEDKSTNINEFKKILATEATKLCHGETEAQESHKAAIAAFEQGDMDNIQAVTISKAQLKDGVFLYELFKMSNLCSSNSEGRRLIRGGGAKLNQQKVTDENLQITLKDFKNNSITLSSGKKRHIKILMK